MRLRERILLKALLVVDVVHAFYRAIRTPEKPQHLEFTRKRGDMAKQAKRTFKLGEIVSDAEATEILGSSSLRGGWFTDINGREVYMCDGSHRDGTRGFKVLQFDGLR